MSKQALKSIHNTTMPGIKHTPVPNHDTSKKDQKPNRNKRDDREKGQSSHVFSVAQKFHFSAMELASTHQQLNKALQLLEQFTDTLTHKPLTSASKDRKDQSKIPAPNQILFSFIKVPRSGEETINGKTDSHTRNMATEILHEQEKAMQKKQKITNEIIKAIANANQSLVIKNMDEILAIKVARNLKQIFSNQPLTLVTHQQSIPLQSLDHSI